MLNYFPIALKSTESDKSIWIEIRNSTIESGKKYLSLHIHCHSGFVNKGGTKKWFHEGIEEGFRQTVFRMPVLKSELEKLVKDIRLKMNPTVDTFKFKFTFLYNNESQIRIHIFKFETDNSFSAQFGYFKEEFESIFQIQTSSKSILQFVDELDQKLQIYSS
ncbi:MAG: hypothetical protein AB8H03_26880 [Saprospiraceae bacterium]